MNKRVRQYAGLLSAIIAYYLIHEGAHLIYALFTGAFKQINLMGLGMQIDIYSEKMTQAQLGVFCLIGSVATLLSAYILIALIGKIATEPIRQKTLIWVCVIFSEYMSICIPNPIKFICLKTRVNRAYIKCAPSCIR